MQTSDISYRNSVIYSIYVRNHTQEGTFRAVEPDLKRIRDLGTDMVWLMPVHPIGQKGKKGSLGCPYSISDYRDTNPCYGSIDDFRHLVDAIHAHGMKCIIDVVYNHTSRDSVLLSQNPDFYWKNRDGKPGNRFEDWTDVYDLNYGNRELWEYQAETLKFWASIVDGFRCDVASTVPVEFWKYAREEVEKVNPSCFWLGETVFSDMITGVRSTGLYIWTDNQMYEAFDAEYQYDIFRLFQGLFDGRTSLETYLYALNSQEYIYPENYMKLRFVENHDTERFASLCPDFEKRMQWLSFMFFQKGPMLIYAGQEFSCTTKPSLFDIDVFDRNGKDISSEIAQLVTMKKSLPTDAVFQAKLTGRNTVEASYYSDNKTIVSREFAL